MISVDSARALLAEHLWEPGESDVSLERANGAVLAAAVRADRPVPAYHRVMMDGYAGAFAALSSPERVPFEIAFLQRAGEPARTLESEGALVEIATGAMLPMGFADTIVPYEDTDRDSVTGLVRVLTPPSVPRAFVHERGSDAASGTVVVPEGTILRAPQIALAATVGAVTLRVRSLPRVTLVSTGDELVAPHEVPDAHQIRRSNVPMLRAALAARGIEAVCLHAPDEPTALHAALSGALAASDLVLLSGGVSRGRADHVPHVLGSLGVEQVFHRVAQRPGKPLYFGRKGNAFVFGLPGNPASTLMCYACYVVPWLLSSLGVERHVASLRTGIPLAHGVANTSELAHFLGVDLVLGARGILGVPVPLANSGDALGLVKCRGFVHIPAGTRIEAGHEAAFYSWEEGP